MTALVFLAALGLIVVAVLAIEGGGEEVVKLRRPAGLITWLTSGNWPAKIGGALMIVGVGALLRFALINLDVAPSLKLAAGIVIALALGLASTLVPEGSARRPVSLALGGAAFGVAYLTAYSAFALFRYLSNPMGLGLLGLTSVAAGVYAVTRSALSLAVLSMVGAYLAPAFAISDPGPGVVYGYYAGASLLTLAMVAMRGWRPLIHLSFLFTLAGGVFFAWTARYYTEPYAGVMLPMVLLLSAIHVAMPIVERGGPRVPWLERLDMVYVIALPSVAALLAVLISRSRLDLSTELISLGVIWAMAAVGLQLARRDGVIAHAVIACLLAVLGVAARFEDLPWELMALALSVGALAAAAWRRPTADRLHGALAGLVLLFGAIHVLSSTATPVEGPAFVNGAFIERIIGATLLIIAGAVCRKVRQSLDTLLLAVGIAWALLSTGMELVRWDLATLALVVHWSLLLVAASLWIPGRRLRVADRNVTLLAIGIIVTALWAAAGDLSAGVAWASLFASSLVLVGMAARPLMPEGDSRDQRFGLAIMAPAAAAIWGYKVGVVAGIGQVQFVLVVAALVSLATLAAARLAGEERGAWLEWTADLFAAGYAGVVGYCTLLDIARDPWAVTLELLCLAGLGYVTWIRHRLRRPTDLLTAACMVGLALVIQANVMRLLGPPGDLDISDVLRLEWSAVVSLLWAVAGSALTIWSRRVGSRALWMAGATLLVASAVKLLLVDFGSLGEIANILAVIAAGAVFLVVGWLAPMPPAAKAAPAAASAAPPASAPAPASARAPATAPAPAPATAPGPASARAPMPPRRTDATERRDDTGSSHRTTAWIIAIIVVTALTLIQHRHWARSLWRELFPHSRGYQSERLPAVVAPPPAAAPLPADGGNDPLEGAAGVTLPATVATARSESAPGAASAAEATAPAAEPPAPEPAQESKPRTWTPPPTVDANGVRTYTQYSYPQALQGRSSLVETAPPPPPPPGDQGLDQLLREGRIRRATERDLDAWLSATGTNREDAGIHAMADYSSGNQYLLRVYVVQRAMTFPDRLFGANRAIFIVPRGVPRPYGEPGHSQVLEMP